MSNQYTAVSIADYNTNPPSDDGAQTVANSVTWDKHKTKLGDPIKLLAVTIDTNVTAAFLLGMAAVTTTKTSAYTIVAADRGKYYSVTNETTITALLAATAGDGFISGVVNSDASAVVTVTGSGSETIGSASDIILFPGESIVWVCDGTNNLILCDGRDKTPSGTIVYGLFTTAEPEYVLAVGGTIGNAASGATLAKEYTESLYEKAKAFSPNAGTEVFADDTAITLPDLRSHIVAGKDNLGGSSADTIVAANADTSGGLVGSETQAAAGSNATTGSTAISTAQSAAHTHGMYDGAGGTRGRLFDETGLNAVTGSNAMDSVGGGSGHTHTGGTFTGSATNIVQPTYFCGAQIKL